MSNPKYEEFSNKYMKTCPELIVPKGKNPFPQMKTDTFRLDAKPGFGGSGSQVTWGYIHEPLNMFPGLSVSEKPRLIVIMGGDGSNYLKLHGEMEITLGKSVEDAETFKCDEASAFYVEKDMMYNINVTKVDSQDCPLHFNEFVFGDLAPLREDEQAEAADGGEGYAKYIKSGEVLWAKGQPHHMVVYPVVAAGSHLFDSKEKIRRTWMPVSVPHTLADKPHSHSFIEFMVFYGTNPNDISDLGGEMEFTVGESEDDLTVFKFNKSTIFCMMPGVWHNPMVIKTVNDPKYPINFCEVSQAHGYTPNSGRTVWIDGSVPTPPPRPAD